MKANNFISPAFSKLVRAAEAGAECLDICELASKVAGNHRTELGAREVPMEALLPMLKSSCSPVNNQVDIFYCGDNPGSMAWLLLVSITHTQL